MDDQEQRDIVETLAPGIYAEVEEVMREIYARLPYGEEITLSNGRVFQLKKFSAVKEHEGRYRFGFDAVFEQGSPDHLEFYTRHTGGGGYVSLSTPDTEGK